MMGYGAGGFVRSDYAGAGFGSLVAHNSFLSVLVEEGLVGLMLYLAMMLSVFYYIGFPRRLWSEGSGSSSSMTLDYGDAPAHVGGSEGGVVRHGRVDRNVLAAGQRAERCVRARRSLRRSRTRREAANGRATMTRARYR